MCLYRHSTRCPWAIQMFLDENPRYWRFIPMTNAEASETAQTMGASSRDLDSTADVRDDAMVQRFIANLPLPPAKYQFSARQYHHQYAFFQLKRDLTMPNLHLDLYNAKIIAVRTCLCSRSYRPSCLAFLHSARNSLDRIAANSRSTVHHAYGIEAQLIGRLSEQLRCPRSIDSSSKHRLV
jgi:hypothetical protein